MIKLRTNNLYRNGRITQFSDGSALLYRPKLTFVGEVTDQYHTVKIGDRLDILAWKFYKNKAKDPSKLWWLIADANNIHNPLDISNLIGTNILIPNLTKALIK